jgi:DNA polymerase-3 subunit delta
VKIQANQLSSYLRQGLLPCYLVTGDEPLLVAEALDDIRSAAREAGFTSRDRHVAAGGFDWSRLREAGASLSLFAEKRIIELALPTGKPGVEGSAAITDLVGNLHEDILLIVTGPRLDKSGQNAKWAKALEKAGAFLPIWPVDARELPGWIAKRMQAAGLVPDREAVTLIADRVEGNLLAASQEIEKLRLVLGEGPVSAADVLAGVADSSRFDVFKLTDAALSGETARALRILGGLRAEGVTPVLVVWSLLRDVRSLARLGEAVRNRQDPGAAMQKAGIWRARQGLFRSAISRHSHASAYRLLKLLGEADARAKGQAPGDPWEQLVNVVICLSGSVRRRAA